MGLQSFRLAHGPRLRRLFGAHAATSVNTSELSASQPLPKAKQTG